MAKSRKGRRGEHRRYMEFRFYGVFTDMVLNFDLPKTYYFFLDETLVDEWVSVVTDAAFRTGLHSVAIHDERSHLPVEYIRSTDHRRDPREMIDIVIERSPKHRVPSIIPYRRRPSYYPTFFIQALDAGEKMPHRVITSYVKKGLADLKKKSQVKIDTNEWVYAYQSANALRNRYIPDQDTAHERTDLASLPYREATAEIHARWSKVNAAAALVRLEQDKTSPLRPNLDPDLAENLERVTREAAERKQEIAERHAEAERIMHARSELAYEKRLREEESKEAFTLVKTPTPKRDPTPHIPSIGDHLRSTPGNLLAIPNGVRC